MKQRLVLVVTLFVGIIAVGSPAKAGDGPTCKPRWEETTLSAGGESFVIYWAGKPQWFRIHNFGPGTVILNRKASPTTGGEVFDLPLDGTTLVLSVDANALSVTLKDTPTKGAITARVQYQRLGADLPRVEGGACDSP